MYIQTYKNKISAVIIKASGNSIFYFMEWTNVEAMAFFFSFTKDKLITMENRYINHLIIYYVLVSVSP